LSVSPLNFYFEKNCIQFNSVQQYISLIVFGWQGTWIQHFPFQSRRNFPPNITRRSVPEHSSLITWLTSNPSRHRLLMSFCTFYQCQMVKDAPDTNLFHWLRQPSWVLELQAQSRVRLWNRSLRGSRPKGLKLDFPSMSTDYPLSTCRRRREVPEGIPRSINVDPNILCNDRIKQQRPCWRAIYRFK